MIFIKKLFKKEYSHFFIYKWGIFAGIIESFLIILATFSLFSLASIMGDLSKNNIFLLVFLYLYSIIFLILSFFIVFGMPTYLAIKKKKYSEALLIIFITMTTLFLFLSTLILFYSI